MKITKSQKISFAFLSVAVGAYALDQFSGSSAHLAAAVPAAESTVPIVANSIPSAVSSISPTGALNATDLADKLQLLGTSLGENGEARDAFAVPATFGAGYDSDHAPVSQRVIKFQFSHRLKAVIYSDGVRQAVVDTSLIKIGQYLDGFELQSVGQMRATFADGDVHAELRIQQDDGSPNPASGQ